MKKFLAVAAVVSMAAGSAMAQQAVLKGTELDRNTKNAEYPIWVRGTDGHDYFCRDELVVKTGNTARQCLSRKGGLFNAGLSGAAPLIFLVGGVAAAAAFSGGGKSSNGTN